jgi:hypothetical protein
MLTYQIYQHPKVCPFLVAVHRIYQGLVSLDDYQQSTLRSRRSLASRKSVDNHLGGFCIDLEGHWRFGKEMGGNGRYFVELRPRQNQHDNGILQGGSLVYVRVLEHRHLVGEGRLERNKSVCSE